MRLSMLAVLLLAACVPAAGPNAEPEAVGVLAQELGEMKGDRPNYVERTILYVHNRARVDPAQANSPDAAPVKPLLWHDDLARAARDHSVDMRDAPCFKHDACDGTPFAQWVKQYWTQPVAYMLGFISAGPGSPSKQMQAWLDEGNKKPPNTMLADTFHWVGVGYAAGGTKYNGYWTELLVGSSDPPAIPRLPSGSHMPDAVQAGEPATFGVVYYDEGGVEPDSVEVVLDGEAHALDLVRGTASAGAYEGQVAISKGCHRYYFRAKADGDGVAYPDGGTLVIGSDDVYTTCKLYQKGGVDAGGGCRVAGRAAPVGAMFGMLLALGLVAGGLRRSRRR